MLLFAGSDCDEPDGSLMSICPKSSKLSPGPQLSAPSLTLNVSRSQVPEGIFLALVSTVSLNVTTEHLIGRNRGTSVDIRSEKWRCWNLWFAFLKTRFIYKLTLVPAEHVFGPSIKICHRAPSDVLFLSKCLKQVSHKATTVCQQGSESWEMLVGMLLKFHGWEAAVKSGVSFWPVGFSMTPVSHVAASLLKRDHPWSPSEKWWKMVLHHKPVSM